MNTQLLDITPYLVTSTNPPSSLSILDVQRCVTLHNYILQYGWVRRGRSLDNFPSQTWFDYHDSEAIDEVLERLEPSTIEFLEKAFVVDGWDHKFFYWVYGLCTPKELFENHLPDLAEEGEEYRYLTLYLVNGGFGCHGDGLNYDQIEHKATMQMNIFEDSITRAKNAPAWPALETVLSSWIEAITVGKIVAAPRSQYIHVQNEIQYPWMNLRFSNGQVIEAVEMYNHLIATIASRMPSLPTQQQHPSTNTGIAAEPLPLLDDATLDTANIAPDSFARRFLSTAQRPADPRLKFIAPGLILPSPSTFAASQPFTSVPVDTDPCQHSIPPILLFPCATDTSTTLSDSDKPFFIPFNAIRSFPPGLYTSDTDLKSNSICEETARLILPFEVGEQDFARRTDGLAFHSRSEVYYAGYQAFGGDDRPHRLVKVLENWQGMVERREWEVGEEGVKGGIGVFMGADQEASANSYVIERSW